MPITTCPRAHPACRLGCKFMCTLVLVVAALRSLLDRPATLRGLPFTASCSSASTSGNRWRQLETETCAQGDSFLFENVPTNFAGLKCRSKIQLLGKIRQMIERYHRIICQQETIRSTHTRSPLARAGHTRSFPTPSSSDRLEPAAEQQPAPRVPSFATRHQTMPGQVRGEEERGRESAREHVRVMYILRADTKDRLWAGSKRESGRECVL